MPSIENRTNVLHQSSSISGLSEHPFLGMSQSLMSGVVLGGVAEVEGSNLARGKIFTASIYIYTEGYSESTEPIDIYTEGYSESTEPIDAVNILPLAIYIYIYIYIYRSAVTTIPIYIKTFR